MVKMFDIIVACIAENIIFSLGIWFILWKKLNLFSCLFHHARKIQHIILWISQFLLLSFLNERFSSFISLCMVPKTIKTTFVNWKNKLIIFGSDLIRKHFIHWTIFIRASLCFNCAESLYSKFLHWLFDKRFNFSLIFTKISLNLN